MGKNRTFVTPPKPLQMKNFEYKKIDLEEPTFRLLRLLKGDDELIQCQLTESNLVSPESHGGYEAVSYTWGNKS